MDGFFANPEGDIARKRLGNGAELVHLRDPRFRSVSVRVLVRTGSVHEGIFCGCGLSHFAEHMAFIGTGGRKEESVSSDAAALGAELNACTYNDRTVYSADCPTGGVGGILKLLSEMLFEPNFSEKSFVTEREVILREMAMCADDADERAYDGLFGKMYLTNPLRYPIIGLRERFEALTPDDLRGYFSRRYCTDNICVCAASDMPHSRFFELAEAAFSRPATAAVSAPAPQPEPTQIAPREVSEYSDCDVAKNLLAVKIRSDFADSFAAWECMAHTLGAGNSSLLSRALKYEDGIVDSVDAEIFRSDSDAALIVAWECAPKMCRRAMHRILDAAYSISLIGFDDAQRRRFAKSRAGFVADSFRNPQTAAETLAGCAFYGADFGMFARQTQFVESAADSRIAEILSGGADIGAYTYSAVLPKSAKPRRRARAAESNASPKSAVLPNGLKIAAIPRAGLAKTNIRLFSRGGLCALSAPERRIYPLAALCVLRDTRTRAFAEISELAEANAVNFYSEFSDAYAAVCAETLAPDFTLGLDLVSDAVRNFSINPDTFETERRAAISDALDNLDDPYTAAAIKMRRAFFGTHALSAYPDGDADALESATAACAGGAIRRLFGSDTCVLAATGDFDAGDFLESAAKYFSDFKPAKKRPAQKPFKFPAAGGTARFKAEKQQCVAFSVFADAGAYDFDSDPIRAVAAEYLGGENGELFDLVRQREGLAYTASVGRVSGCGVSAQYFYALAARENLGRVAEIFAEVSDRLAGVKIDSERFAKARDCARARFADRMCDNAEISAYAAARVCVGAKPLSPDAEAERIASVKISDFARYARGVFSRGFDFSVF